jgi:hypothetical protein
VCSRRWRAGPDPLTVVPRFPPEVKKPTEPKRQCRAQVPGPPRLYSFCVDSRGITFGLLACCIMLRPACALPSDVQIQESYEWPGRAAVQWSISQGDLLVRGRSEHPAASPAGTVGAPVFGVVLPWLLSGPLLGRGMLRQVFDPLSCSAGSRLLDEPTALVLDMALPPSGAGVLFMPFPGYCGFFFRPGREGGTEYGAYTRLSFRGGAAAECVLMASRPDAISVPDEWFLEKGAFPGGPVANFAGRLLLDSSPLSFSCSVGVSSAQFAAPGAFSTLWIHGRMPDMEAAVLLAGATSGYRSPEGRCASAASRLSGFVRLGRDRRRGTLEAGISRDTAVPGFSPRRDIPTRDVVHAAFCREFAGTAFLFSLLIEAEKAVGRDRDGVRTDTTRGGTTACVSLGSLEAAAAAGVSDRDGVSVRGSLSLRPSARLRIVAQGGVAAGPAATTSVKVAVENGNQKAAVQAGIEDYPLTRPGRGSRGDLASCFRLSLSCSLIYR